MIYFKAISILKDSAIKDVDAIDKVIRNCSIEDKLLRKFAIACAKSVEHMLTDVRSRNAIAVAEAYVNGKATKEELATAAHAARAAYAARAANAARAARAANAADADAACAAADAAYAAYYAAANAAYAAAYAAANAAAYAAYYAASAADAAYAEARKKQRMLLLSMLERKPKGPYLSNQGSKINV